MFEFDEAEVLRAQVEALIGRVAALEGERSKYLAMLTVLAKQKDKTAEPPAEPE